MKFISFYHNCCEAGENNTGLNYLVPDATHAFLKDGNMIMRYRCMRCKAENLKPNQKEVIKVEQEDPDICLGMRPDGGTMLLNDMLIGFGSEDVANAFYDYHGFDDRKFEMHKASDPMIMDFRTNTVNEQLCKYILDHCEEEL